MMPESSVFVPTSDNHLPSSPTPPESPNLDRPNVVKGFSGLPKVVEAVSNVDMTQMAAKVESLKKWTVGTFKNSKQQFLEHMGKIDRTVDIEFEQECENVKELHRRYGAVVAASRQFRILLGQFTEAEKQFAESLYLLGLKECSINKSQCTATSETMRRITDHAKTLENYLRYFSSTMETIHEKAIVDTLDTIYATEAARIEFDVYRHELTALHLQTNASAQDIQSANEKAEAHRDKYDQLKADVKMKFRLLEQNRMQVMSIQLDKLHSALSAYYSGNVQLLSDAVAELSALRPPESKSPIME